MDRRLRQAIRDHDQEDTLATYLELVRVLVQMETTEQLDGRDYLQYLYEDLISVCPETETRDLRHVSLEKYSTEHQSVCYYEGHPVVIRLKKGTTQLGVDTLDLYVSMFSHPFTDDLRDIYATIHLAHNHYTPAHLKLLRSAEENPNRVMSPFIFNAWPAHYNLENFRIPFSSGAELLEDMLVEDMPRIKEHLGRL